MRLLHVIPTYLPAVRYGGPAIATHALCRALVDRGHEVEVFTTNLNGFDAPRTPTGRRILDGVAVNYFSADAMPRLSWAPRLGQELRRTIGGFDVAHLHGAFLWPTWAAARRARRAGVPYVLAPRGMLVKDLIRQRHQLRKSAWIALIERANLRDASAVQVTSTVEREDLDAFGWPLRRIELVPNGMDISAPVGSEPVSDDVRAATASRPYALFFGRLSWKKGLERLLRSLPFAGECNVVIAGTDDEGLSARLAVLAAEMGVADRVHIVPRTLVGADKAWLYAQAGAFVLLSDSENFGNTVLEAMSHGLPIVVTPGVGAAEIVTESGGGVVAPAEDHPAIGRAIGDLLANRAQAKAMGRAGRDFVRANLGWDRIAERMEALYASLAGQGRRSHAA